MRVEIFADVVCPWCYVGLARFDRALAGFAHRDDVEVVHRAFELDAAAPPAGTGTTLQMLRDKYGMSAEQALAAEQRVAALAAAEGLPFVVDRRHGNTFDVHRVLRLASQTGHGDQAHRAVFRAYFSGAADVFDPAGLTAVAGGAGLDAAAVDDVLAGDRYAAEVRADEREAARYGISGVPFFVIDTRLGLSGAQPAETLAAALEQAWKLSTAGSPGAS